MKVSRRMAEGVLFTGVRPRSDRSVKGGSTAQELKEYSP